MATEASQPAQTSAHDAPQPEPAADAAQKPPVRRSWRRKYRKMRIKFDEAMTQSNHLIMEEWKAMGTARRLQAENDQLLDALLDFNNQPRVSARHRFDLSDPSSTARRLPFQLAGSTDSGQAAALEPGLGTEAAQQRLQELRAQLSSGAITAEQYTQDADQLHSAQGVQQVHRSLASLEASVPHTSLAHLSAAPDGIDLSEHAPGYMSPAHEEEYLLALDQLLDDPAFDPSNPPSRTLHLGPSQPPLSEKELTIRNPDSVYSWLRKNQPQVFLQDKDAPHHENTSEKAAPKGSSKRGRQSNIGGGGGGTPGPKEDHDGEDSAAPEGKAKGRKGGGDPDDTAYRPKGGSSRPAKRKREAGEGEAKGARKKNRPSTAVAAATAAASAAPAV